jgi:hypothetical protein
MAPTTAGLTNDGKTTHYSIRYDDTLSAADGKDRANGLIDSCEKDFELMSSWFNHIKLDVPMPIPVDISPGPHASASWNPAVTLIPGNGSSLALVRYLLVSEVTEMFMRAQADGPPPRPGWFGTSNEGSAGEGLSRFLAGQFLIINGLGVTEPGFALANSWMASPRLDFVNAVDPTDAAFDAKTGCAILFIYYLHTQQGFSVEEIVAAAAAELSGVYRNLTRRTEDPFPRFKQLLDRGYPGTTTIPGDNPDNPFPIREVAYVVWKGAETDQRLFLNRGHDGSNFSDQVILPGAGGSGDSPAIAVFLDRVFVAWKGATEDGRLFFNSSDDGGSFTEQQIIPGTGGSSHGPALAGFNGRLYLAWKGSGDDARLFFNSSPDGVNFTDQQVIPETGGTSNSPALAALNDRLYLAWKGAGDDPRLFFNSTADGVNFTEQQIIPETGGTSNSPALASFNGRLYLAWKGAGDDPRLFFNSTPDGVNFTEQQIIPGTGGSSHAPALAAFNGKLYVVWKGSGDDARLFFNSSPDGVNFTDQQIIPGTGGTSAHPAIAARQV